MNRWKRKVQALIRLADDQRGKPEGDLARQKLLSILNKYPEAREYQPVQELARRDLTLKDVGYMKRNLIPITGSWTGANLQQAIKLMEADYRERIRRHKTPKLTEGYTAQWICQECYDQLGREYECFTDVNIIQKKCPYCRDRVGVHHVVNPPPAMPKATEGLLPSLAVLEAHGQEMARLVARQAAKELDKKILDGN
jgi:hypothetical protein